jgi:hypothetical protein
VVLEEDVVAGQVDERQQPVGRAPPALGRIVREPQSQRAVVGHPVRRGGMDEQRVPGIGVNRRLRLDEPGAEGAVAAAPGGGVQAAGQLRSTDAQDARGRIPGVAD